MREASPLPLTSPSPSPAPHLTLTSAFGQWKPSLSCFCRHRPDCTWRRAVVLHQSSSSSKSHRKRLPCSANSMNSEQPSYISCSHAVCSVELSYRLLFLTRSSNVCKTYMEIICKWEGRHHLKDNANSIKLHKQVAVKLIQSTRIPFKLKRWKGFVKKTGQKLTHALQIISVEEYS